MDKGDESLNYISTQITPFAVLTNGLVAELFYYPNPSVGNSIMVQGIALNTFGFLSYGFPNWTECSGVTTTVWSIAQSGV